MNGYEQFCAYYDSINGCITTKPKHWETWKAAQDALLAAHGPVTMLEMPSADESYSKGWSDCMEIAKK